MSEFKKFPSIDQFKNVVRNIKNVSEYVGKDEDGHAIYDSGVEKPTLKFTGTVKLHGTNAAVGFHNGDMWSQKRTGICTVEKDNAGFSFFVESNKEIFKRLSHKFIHQNTTIVYGEWCGGNIQKGVAICQLPKMFVVFDVKVYTPDGKILWWSPEDIKSLSFPDANIHNVYEYPTYEVEIDFNYPQKIQNKLTEITESVEAECPVAKAFGISGIGEGVVYRTEYEGIMYRFKVKGVKHSSTKVKTLAEVDVVKMENIREFAICCITENRLNQGIEQVFTINSEEPTKKRTGDFLRWVVNDVIKEEMDTMKECGFEPKDVNGLLSNIARVWFFKYLDTFTDYM